MNWFRMHSDAIDDEKLRLLAFEDRWHFVALLCLKCAGLVDDNSGEMLERKIAVKLGLRGHEISEVKRRLMDVGLIDENWQPKGWDRRQFISDNSTKRVQKHRAKQVMKQRCNVSETPPKNTPKKTDETAMKQNETKMKQNRGLQSTKKLALNHGIGRKKQRCNVSETPPDTETDTEISPSLRSGESAREKARAKNKSSDPPITHLPHGITRGMAEDLIAYRRDVLKLPLTQRALDALLAKLARAPDVGLSPDEALAEMMEAGWRGLNLSWLKRRMSGEGVNHATNGRSSNGCTRGLSAVERAERAYLEHADEPIDYAIGAGLGR